MPAGAPWKIADPCHRGHPSAHDGMKGFAAVNDSLVILIMLELILENLGALSKDQRACLSSVLL
jgi:hypothetical protein